MCRASGCRFQDLVETEARDVMARKGNFLPFGSEERQTRQVLQVMNGLLQAWYDQHISVRGIPYLKEAHAKRKFGEKPICYLGKLIGLGHS